MNLGLAGKYTIYKQKVAMKDGIPLLDENGNQVLLGEQEKVAEFENLITNNGLDLIGKKASCNYMIVSSDNTVPSITDTTINILGVTQLDGTGNGNVNKNVTTAPYWVSYKRVRRFDAGVGTGNIAKIAISNNPTGTDLFSIALVKDGNGNPTTITKLADEILDVSYELRQYINTGDTATTITISGKTHNVTSRIWGLGRWDATWVDSVAHFGGIGITETNLVGITSNIGGVVIPFNRDAYVVGSYKSVVRLSSIGLDTGNFATGINTVLTTQGLLYQFGINPPILKKNTQILQLPPITISWGRYDGAL